MKRIVYFLLLVLFVLQACSPTPATESATSNTEQELVPPLVIKEPSNSSLPGAAGAANSNTSLLTLCSGAADTNAAAFEEEVIRLVNVERAKEGLDPVVSQSQLTQAAQNHAIDLACYGAVGHTSSDGSTLIDRLDLVGYMWLNAGENMAVSYATPAAVVTAWMNSSGHRANILDPEFTQMGIGYVYNPAGTYKHYWVMDLGSEL
ncbi:MAG TPA: CAP domain-containing protein [Anaerolineales bacterium]|nr:CAP domain-containing protein [Anaerolineales bacterium]